MKITYGIEMLNLPAIKMPGSTTIHPTLIWDQNSVLLIDTGLPGQLPLLGQAIRDAGFEFEQLTHIVLTHHDIDHIGNLAAILKMVPHQVTVMCHELEKPYIQNDLPPLKIASPPPDQTERLVNLTEEQRRAVLNVFENFKSYTALVNQTLVDGEQLPCLGGIRVIHMPGHTPGHICLYHPTGRTLIAGDTFFVADGAMIIAPSFVNHDTPQALISLQKLLHFEVENIICYHGGFYKDQAGKKIRESVQF